MSDVAIRVQGLSKLYRIGKAVPYHTLRESLMGVVTAPWRKFKAAGTPQEGAATSFWALSDVSFNIKQGEVVGIVGRNGAGKSTLLKLLSRITDPTKGEVDIHGRVGSLLEVGTGFHPELTGRENIFLNGAILGMRKTEISRKFDEIVAFSEIEEFLDTPVKRYSSGMYTRLAFAVAAHLDPEVLIVDEVLAVGDAAFQRKCTGKMSDVAKQGRTVLFVSHNMGALQALCTRGILLRKGKLMADGAIDAVIGEYLNGLNTSAGADLDNPERSGNGKVRVSAAVVQDETGQVTEHVIAGRPVTLKFDFTNHGAARRFDVGMTLYNRQGIAVTHFSTITLSRPIEANGNDGTFTVRIPRLPLPVSRYRVAIAIHVEGGVSDLIPNVLAFDVASSVFFPTGKNPDVQYCAALVDHEWGHEVRPLATAAPQPAGASQ